MTEEQTDIQEITNAVQRGIVQATLDHQDRQVIVIKNLNVVVNYCSGGGAKLVVMEEQQSRNT